MRVPSRGLARISEQKHDPGPADPAGRAALVAAAGEALWYYVVQREAIGLRDVDAVLREYRVAHEVYLRMGPRARGR